MKSPLEISIQDMQELQQKGQAKIIPFGDEFDAIGIVQGKEFYLKRIDHYSFLGIPQEKENRHYEVKHD